MLEMKTKKINSHYSSGFRNRFLNRQSALMSHVNDSINNIITRRPYYLLIQFNNGAARLLRLTCKIIKLIILIIITITMIQQWERASLPPRLRDIGE